MITVKTTDLSMLKEHAVFVWYNTFLPSSTP